MYEFQSLNISRIRRAFSRSLSSRRIVLARLFAMGYTSTGQLLLSVIWQSGMLTFESFQEMTLWSDLFCSLLQGIELGGGRRLGSARFRKRYSPRLFEVSTIAQLYLNGLERITMKQSIVFLFYATPHAKLVNLALVLLGLPPSFVHMLCLCSESRPIRLERLKMPLTTVIITIVAVGIVLWLVNRFIPM